MALLSDQDRAVLTERFEETLDRDVTIKLFTQSAAHSLLVLPGRESRNGDYMKVTLDLMQELVATSPKLRLEVYDIHGSGTEEAKRLGIEQIPAIVLGDDEGGRVRFYGAPVGNEFPTILTGIESISKDEPQLREPVAAVARERIDEQVHLRVFVTPT